MALFRTKVFAGDQVKMRLLEWALIQCTWYAYKKRKHTQIKIHIEEAGLKTQEKVTYKQVNTVTRSHERGTDPPSGPQS